MTFRDTIIYFIFLLMIGLSTGAWCGQIIYPWNATTAIVKAGENFTIWYDADIDEAIESIALRRPYNSVSIPYINSETGSWTYDESSGATYNTRISVSVPSGSLSDSMHIWVSDK